MVNIQIYWSHPFISRAPTGEVFLKELDFVHYRGLVTVNCIFKIKTILINSISTPVNLHMHQNTNIIIYQMQKNPRNCHQLMKFSYRIVYNSQLLAFIRKIQLPSFVWRLYFYCGLNKGGSGWCGVSHESSSTPSSSSSSSAWKIMICMITW